MSKEPHEEAFDLVTRAAVLAKLELVAEELDRAVERLTAVVEEIKAQDSADCEERGDGGDGRGADQ